MVTGIKSDNLWHMDTEFAVRLLWEIARYIPPRVQTWVVVVTSSPSATDGGSEVESWRGTRAILWRVNQQKVVQKRGEERDSGSI